MGPAGPKGETGTAGSIGLTGLKGETGTAGATGPSEVTVVSIPNFTVATASAYGYGSTTVGSLAANKSYHFSIYLRGTSTYTNISIGIDVLVGGTSVPFSFSRDNSGYSTYVSRVSTSYGIHIEGTAATSGTPSAIEVRVIDGYADTNGAPLTLSGKAYITLVGAIN
jgi:hypothetical protein